MSTTRRSVVFAVLALAASLTVAHTAALEPNGVNNDGVAIIDLERKEAE